MTAFAPRRVLVAGVWDDGPGYPRTDSLLQALRSTDVEVEICRVEPPALHGSKTELAARPWRWPGYALRSRAARRQLREDFAAAVARFEPDLVLVPYPGHMAIHWIRDLFAGPIWLDLFLSAYSTVVDDRQLFSPGSIPARMLATLDRRACRAADRVLLDTRIHALDVARRTKLPESHFGWVPVADQLPGDPTPIPERTEEPLRAIFFGTGVPLHGLPVWVDAMSRVEGIHWTIFGGDEPTRHRAQELLGERVDLRAPFAPLEEIRAEIERSHLVCGVVGTSEKARAVVPFKVVHGLAHGRLVLTGDHPAVREMLESGQDSLAAPPGDPERLADVLRFALSLDTDRLRQFGEAALRRAEFSFSIEAVARSFDREFSIVWGDSSENEELAAQPQDADDSAPVEAC